MFVDVKSNGATSNQRSGENLFGSNSNSKTEPSHLHVGFDRQQAYRPSDARRDEAVNTVDATFRG